MTIFWLVQLQVAIIDYSLYHNLNRYPCWHDFYDILFHQPTLQNPRLWSAYFTESDLFCGDRAWHQWVAPSRQPLPALAPPLDQPASMPVAHGGSGRLLRFAFAVMQYIHRSPADELNIVAKAQTILQTTTVRLRAKGAGIPPYSKTHACYWIHMARACLLSLDPLESGQTINASQLTFATFEILFRLPSRSWTEYYSEATWDALASRIDFAAPDKKPLPHVINVANRIALEEILSEQLESQDAEESPRLLEDVLSAILSESEKVKIGVPSCCAESVDCDWGIPIGRIRTCNWKA